MKEQNNVFGKSQDYNATLSRQEKCQRAGSYLKEGLDKKDTTLLELRSPHQTTAHTVSIRNY